MTDEPMDFGSASELLAAANRGEAADAVQPTPPAPENNPPADQGQVPSGSPADAGTTPAPAEDTFAPGIDPLTLPPELQAIYRNMQSHFTRSQQALAQEKAAYDGLNVEEARGALDFVQQLNTDPSFAMAVHSELSNALQAAGMTVAEADAAAATAVQDQYQEEPEYGSVPPEVLQRLERAEQFMSTYEEQQTRSQFEAELTRQESAIRQSRPEWTDEDINTVYALAYSHGGDLQKAAEAYTAEQARWATRFMGQKASVPSGTPAGTGHAVPPASSFASTAEATAAAEELFRQAFDN